VNTPSASSTQIRHENHPRQLSFAVGELALNRPDTDLSCDVAIIGGGFSGVLVSVQLLKQARPPFSILLVERLPHRLGRGVAYGTTLDCHLLIVPAGNMSAFPDDPENFLRWAKTQEQRLLNPPWVTEVGASSFLPRRAYGDYLVWLLGQAEQMAKPGVRMLRRLDEVTGISHGQHGATLTLAGGICLRARRVVLALGNFRPGDPFVSDGSFYQSPRYHNNPWTAQTLAAVLATRSCLLVGSGLTMVDWAIALGQNRYQGTIHSLSRRGLWPQAHHPGPGVDRNLDLNTPMPTVNGLLRKIRQAINAVGIGQWRSVIDALRPHNQTLWQSLPLAEKKRFMRHARPFWDCHRHRIAPVVAERLQAMFSSGQLHRHVGRIVEYREGGQGIEVIFRHRVSERLEALNVEAVVNCTGSESDYRKLESPLVADLLSQGMARPDALSLGLDVAADGALINSAGNPSDCLFTLGPPQKGILWETTAVPEIRRQAAVLANLLLSPAHRIS
jgi:uncharacterized NAD(P)/FAD-binding protein YdhS